jgi:hypothetical protein
MVIRPAVILASLLFIGADCGDRIDAPLCVLHVADNFAHCSDGKKQWDVPLEELEGYLAASSEVWDKIGRRLEECDRLLDPDVNTP